MHKKDKNSYNLIREFYGFLDCIFTNNLYYSHDPVSLCCAILYHITSNKIVQFENNRNLEECFNESKMLCKDLKNENTVYDQGTFKDHMRKFCSKNVMNNNLSYF